MIFNATSFLKDNRCKMGTSVRLYHQRNTKQTYPPFMKHLCCCFCFVVFCWHQNTISTTHIPAYIPFHLELTCARDHRSLPESYPMVIQVCPYFNCKVALSGTSSFHALGICHTPEHKLAVSSLVTRQLFELFTKS